MKEPVCGNCLLFRKDETCGVAILLDGEKFHLPVSRGDRCHMDELGIEVQQIRWWVEDPSTGERTDKNGVVKVEYPE